MVRRASLKIGFTLVEALTSMLIISIFFAVMSKTIISKPKTATKPEYHHGYYECYRTQSSSGDISGTVVQKHSSDVHNGEEITDKSTCEFTPVQGTAYAVVYSMETVNNPLIYESYSVYQRVFPQFNDSLLVPKDKFYKVYNAVYDSGQSSYLSYQDFYNFLDRNYPDSSLKALMKETIDSSSPTRVPYNAIFICW